MNSLALRNITLAAIAVSCGAAALHAAPVNLIASDTAWYRSSTGFSGGSGSNGLIGGVLKVNPASEGGEMLSYFDPVSLSAGDTLTLNFTYSISGAVHSRGSSLRIGLFNSNESDKVTANAFENAAADDYTGYFISGNPGSTTAANGALRFRDESANTSLIRGDLPPTLTTGGNQRATLNTSYNAFIAITRLDASSLFIEYSLGGASVSGTYAADVTTFDTIGVYFGRLSSADPTTLSISSMTLNLTTVPEPAGAAVLAGAAALGFIGSARRRRRA